MKKTSDMTLDEPLEEELRDFAWFLSVARPFWRNYPELLEAKEFPEPFLSALNRKNPGEPHPDDPKVNSYWIESNKRLIEAGLLKAPSTENAQEPLVELRAEAKGLDGKRYDEFFAAAFDRDMDVDERAFLTVCQRIYRENCHMDTPVENFLVDLVSTHKLLALTRADIYGILREFEANWRDAITISRRFYREHQQLVTADKIAVEQDPDAVCECAQ